MKLEPADGIEIDIDERFRKSIAGLPREIDLEGNAMQCAIAKRLLGENADHIVVRSGGEPVRCMSLEAYGTRFLEIFLEGKDSLQDRCILHTIPEELLVKYAEHQEIPIVREEKTPVREMLERIRREQPQTFFSLAGSAQRLSQRIEGSPVGLEKHS